MAPVAPCQLETWLLLQIVGFFVIEERVGRLGHNGIGAQADIGWSRAVTRLTTLLEGSFDAATSADTVLVVKDFMQLAITALGTTAMGVFAGCFFI